MSREVEGGYSHRGDVSSSSLNLETPHSTHGIMASINPNRCTRAQGETFKLLTPKRHFATLSS